MRTRSHPRQPLAVALLAALVCLLVPRTGWVTLVSFHEVTLAEMVMRSGTIVVAERAASDPARPSKATDSFFTVVESLRGTQQPKALIYVAPAYQRLHDAIGKHIQEHGYEGAPSPIEDAYKSSLTEVVYAKQKRVVLFMVCPKGEPRCELSTVYGYEALKKRADVVAAIAAVDKPRTP